jgi:PPK2 family polyphosphate:nucleotide phosphotransferase
MSTGVDHNKKLIAQIYEQYNELNSNFKQKLFSKGYSMKQYTVKPDTKVNLSEWDPNDTGEFKGGKKKALTEVEKMNDKLEALQELLYAEHKHKVLIIFQGMDTGGKDGAIRRVFNKIDPMGVRVASFKAPTPDDLNHDFLWRVHKHVPGSGEVVIFNRSHYEDVLIVRVHNIVPPEVWSKRYDQINEFERILAENGTTILKFYLHIDSDEQKERLQARLDDPTKRWKFHRGDLEERKYWPDYMQAYEDMLSKTSTDYAPWTIVPANRKWYRDVVISSVIINRLDGLNMKYPEPEENLDKVVIV